MGRRKTYDREDIADRAMRLFWKRGYHATSTRELSEEMGVNPYSLYAEFGSKAGLYQAALERYEDVIVHRHFGALEAEGASLRQIRDVLDFFGDNGARSGSELGCLLCNAGTERAPTPQLSEASTARFVDRLVCAFRAALLNARAAGELGPDAPVEELARFFPTVLMGVFVLSRAQVDGRVLRATADQALARLEGAGLPKKTAAAQSGSASQTK